MINGLMFRWAVLFLTALPAYRLTAQCPDGTPPPCRGSSVRAPATNSIAVLYFENASRDTADQYLADGITEEIATSLGRVGRLHVVSPAAVRRAQRASGGDPARLARALGVRHLVEGSVRRAGPQARITARLLGPDARTALWTDAYTRPTADLLALEEEIASQVASGVVGALLPDERRSLARSADIDPVAHDHVLRGNFQLARRSEATIRRAIGEYEAAVALDSSYALAWGRLALGQALLRFWAGLADEPTATAESIQVRGERAAARALRLDSTIADPWAALGYLRLYRDPVGMRGVLAALQRAVALDPNSGEAHHQLGAGYLWHMDSVRARAEMLRALELDPGRLVTFDNLAFLSLLERRYAEAVRWSDSAIAVDPTHSYVYAPRAAAEALLGDTAAALRDAATSERLGSNPTFAQPRCVVLGLLKAPDAGAACAAVLATSRSPVDSAVAFIALGDVEHAVDALQAAAAARKPFLWVTQSQPFLDSLRSSPRYRQLRESLRPAESP